MVRRKSYVEDVDDESVVELLPPLLEDTDKQYGPAIKAVIDRGLEKSFEKAVARHIRKKNSEIKSICSQHYEEFIVSIDNLLTVQGDVQQIRDRAILLNDAVQKSGQMLIEKAEELTRYRNISANIEHLINLIGNCKYIDNLVNRAVEQISQGKYFSALRTLDSLQRNQLPKFKEYEFAKKIEEKIPMILFSIRQNVKSQFDVWLQQ
jgi:hypothetical protein